LIDWIEMGYAPENYSQAQLDELETLTERWVADYMRRAKIAKKGKRTRHSSDPKTRANIANLSKLLEIALRGGAFRRAEQEGISAFAVRKIVVRLGGENWP
jgi:hypothetical protein